MATKHGDRVVLAVNPTAGFGSGGEAARRAAALLGESGHPVVLIEAPDAEALVASLRAELQDPPAALVVSGGDGMVHLAVNLIAGTEIALGIVPSGTGNDLARGLGIPLADPEAAVVALLAGLASGGRRIDALRITRPDGTLDRWALGVLSAGFDSAVNERANRMRRPRGASRYTIALARELISLTPRRYRLTVDGVPREVDAMLLSAANNVSIGGGMKITPDARLDDGLLDLFIVTPLGRIRFAAVFPQVFRGTHTGHPAVRIERARSVLIEAEGVTGYADGERIGEPPLQVDVVPAAVRVLA